MKLRNTGFDEAMPASLLWYLSTARNSERSAIVETWDSKGFLISPSNAFWYAGRFTFSINIPGSMRSAPTLFGTRPERDPLLFNAYLFKNESLAISAMSLVMGPDKLPMSSSPTCWNEISLSGSSAIFLSSRVVWNLSPRNPWSPEARTSSEAL